MPDRRGVPTTDAVRSAERATALRPRDATLLTQLAMFHRDTGHPEEAIKILLVAVAFCAAAGVSPSTGGKGAASSAAADDGQSVGGGRPAKLSGLGLHKQVDHSSVGLKAREQLGIYCLPSTTACPQLLLSALNYCLPSTNTVLPARYGPL